MNISISCSSGAAKLCSCSVCVDCQRFFLFSFCRYFLFSFSREKSCVCHFSPDFVLFLSPVAFYFFFLIAFHFGPLCVVLWLRLCLVQDCVIECCCCCICLPVLEVEAEGWSGTLTMEVIFSCSQMNASGPSAMLFLSKFLTKIVTQK